MSGMVALATPDRRLRRNVIFISYRLTTVIHLYYTCSPFLLQYILQCIVLAIIGAHIYAQFAIHFVLKEVCKMAFEIKPNRRE